MAQKTYNHEKGALKPVIRPRLKEDPQTGLVIQKKKDQKKKAKKQ